jgi:osmotically-inducible protein OsmY
MTGLTFFASKLLFLHREKQFSNFKLLFMKNKYQIQEDVVEEIKWHPHLNSSEIGVSVKNGIVTLSGMVDSHSKKVSAENAARKVAGVKAVAVDIIVRLSPAYRKTDTEIAEVVVNALKWNTAIKHDKIKIKVEDGNVKLYGEVDWEYQRTAVESAVENLSGVRQVINMITVKPVVSSSDIQRKIRAAFHRSATINASGVISEVEGGTVTLRGRVRSLAEKQDAEQAVWLAPGVDKVVNQIEIELPAYEFED